MPIQTTDIHKTAAADIGINFGATSLLVVEAGVIVASDLAEGVLSTNFNSVLINHGSISSGSTFGVRFNLNTGRILNAEDGSITGVNGLGIDGFSVGAVNFGSIAATNSGVTFLAGSSKGTLDNRGDVYGLSFGVTDLTSSGGSIMNSGAIEGGVAGVGFATAAGAVTHVVNSGTIRGGANSILSINNGALDLRNSGTLFGDILLQTNGKDTLVNTGTIAGNVRLGGGDDGFNGTGGKSGTIFGEAGIDKLTGGAGADTLNGGIGNDTLTGALGNDRLLGEAGNDTLTGGAGIDTLTGGANNDAFLFNAGLAAANRDVITDFFAPQDVLQLENAIFTKLGAGVHVLNPAFFRLGATAIDANDFIVYNKTTGALFYDANASAAGGAIQFATLSNKAAISAADFFLI
jgi:serralysin